MLLYGASSRLLHSLNCISICHHGRFVTSSFVTQMRHKTKFAFPSPELRTFEDDYTETPSYPSIDPETRRMSRKNKAKRQKILDWHTSIRESSTVEKKMMMLNAFKKYGWKRWELTEHNFAYNCEPFYKYITRTHLVPDFVLPDEYHDPDVISKATELVQKIKEPLSNVLKLELQNLDYHRFYLYTFYGDSGMYRSKWGYGIGNTISSFWDDYGDLMMCRSKTPNILYPVYDVEKSPEEVDRVKTTAIVNQVHRILISVLADTVPHLKTCQVDYNPSIEAFWICGGMEPTEEIRNERKEHNEFYREVRSEHREVEDGPVDDNFQYYGSAILQIRNVNPLKNHVEGNSALCTLGDSIPPRFRHYPDTAYDLENDYKFATIKPGHWSGDDHRSSILSIHPQHYLRKSNRDNEFWKEDELSSINSQAILTSYGRLLAQAYTYGFDQFSDIDYPFSTQCISTNGLFWSFYAYQLNTIKLDDNSLAKNKRQNLCWGTKPMSILNEKGELNEEVLGNLVKFYIQPPSPIDISKTSTGQVTPYLTEKLQEVDEQERHIIFANVKDMYIHKYLHPSKNPFPEIYDWERIYKVEHKTRPIDALRRFFELPKGYKGSDPYNEPYPWRNPWKLPAALKRYRRILKQQKEAEQLQAVKDAEKDKFTKGGFDDNKE